MSIHTVYNICIDVHKKKTFPLKYEIKYLFNGSLRILMEKIKQN